MQVVNSLPLPPGCCFICRVAQRDSFIDTGVSYDFDGAFYVCNLCLGEMAQMMSYMSFDQYKDLRQSKEELERINFELIKRVGELEKLSDALVNAGFRLRDSGDVVRVGGYSSPPHESSIDGAQGTEIKLGVGEGTPSESSDDEGMAELHADEFPTSDDDFSLDL